ncbi:MULTISPECIES: FEKKY domain-containing protein [Chryseobacterium]|uniref:Uncharacterized protein n=1 Tax=Chryseobacterium camelliae TaxID=1265445 RepID=A0ABU0TKQ7_9FLAO|nr:MULTISPECIES: hypothetical protein [Chryseobacterium]MDT3408514.1 hypothetical protein [Pseudacidovorax intermedius]MDQ1097631.1 hypothetical protein [Chryseobacterium camelliae]MDQ1101560.1 hypothetical protein [Chryseobacterium sp. SORGH_AS_1048]MDR6085003.1 hypothetical protein [Chryseobacterium sp. SORGH_AS_0909]MDR6129357.1 hypothetical protein [Chryseobacterium sp. SORGH_AS_1175]
MKTKRTAVLILLLISGVISAQQNDTKIIIKDKKRHAIENTSRQQNMPHFIQFGIMSHSHDQFREKYKVDVVYENCVIGPLRSQQAKENNRAIAAFLTKKYGESWKKDLEIIPYGL